MSSAAPSSPSSTVGSSDAQITPRRSNTRAMADLLGSKIKLYSPTSPPPPTRPSTGSISKSENDISSSETKNYETTEEKGSVTHASRPSRARPARSPKSFGGFVDDKAIKSIDETETTTTVEPSTASARPSVSSLLPPPISEYSKQANESESEAEGVDTEKLINPGGDCSSCDYCSSIAAFRSLKFKEMRDERAQQKHQREIDRQRKAADSIGHDHSADSSCSCHGHSHSESESAIGKSYQSADPEDGEQEDVELEFVEEVDDDPLVLPSQRFMLFKTPDPMLQKIACISFAAVAAFVLVRVFKIDLL